MDSFFHPKTIVIYGASSKRGKSGNNVLRNILNYTKENIYLINPKATEILGITCYKRIFDIPIKKIDLAIIIIPVQYVLGALEDCIDFGVKSVIIESGALYIKGENDADDQANLKLILEKLRNSGKTRVMGPNSIGTYSAPDLITSLIYFDRLPNLKQKNLSIISQTGLTLSGLLQGQNYIQEIGISKIAAIGNKIDVNESDVLDVYENDDSTGVIALYLEDIKEGQRFKQQCMRIIKEKKKPILLLKSGKTEKGKQAIISHTKSLAGNYKIIEALAKQIGVITVDDFNEMFTLAKMIVNQPIPKGNRLAVISISGAGTVLSCDLADKYGLELPPLAEDLTSKMSKLFPEFAWEDVYNPLDIWSAVEFSGPDKAYIEAGKIFLERKENYDALIYFLTGIKETQFDWSKLAEISEKSSIPIYMGFFGGDKKIILQWREELEEKYNIPTFESIKLLMNNISKLLR